MYPFFETISITHNQFNNLDLHQTRLNQTFKQYYPNQIPHNLTAIFSSLNEEFSIQIKMRLSYNSQTYRIETIPYSQQKHIQFFLYEVNNLIYDNKFHDRYIFNYLKNIHGNNSEIIFLKGGHITDTTYSNLCFFNDSQWIIPEHYLLTGTQRSLCLQNNIALSRPIHYSDLTQFTKFKLINAMNDFNNSPIYPISLINPTIHAL